MQDDIRRLNTISHNIANVLTPGFKRQVAVSPGFAYQLAAAQRQQSVAGPGVITIDPSAGALRPTGSGQDVAIDGAGFFEVATPDGAAYTRQGSLRVDAQGRLVGAHGMPVMGVGGEIVLGGGAFAVKTNGDIVQDGKVAGRLKVVLFENPEALLPSGAGLYLQGGARIHNQIGAVALRPGFAEASNVSAPQEMVRLTDTVRHFESLQKLVQGYDEMLEKTIRKLGEF